MVQENLSIYGKSMWVCFNNEISKYEDSLGKPKWTDFNATQFITKKRHLSPILLKLMLLMLKDIFDSRCEILQYKI